MNDTKGKIIEMLNEQIKIGLMRIDHLHQKEADLYNAIQEIADLTDRGEGEFGCSTCDAVFDITQIHL